MISYFVGDALKSSGAQTLMRYLQNSAEPLADARGSETRIDNKERNGRLAEFCKYLLGPWLALPVYS